MNSTKQPAMEVMQEILFSTLVESMKALKDASKGVPNTLLRDVNAIHDNSTFADLPPGVQQALNEATRAAFNRLRKEGYAVALGGAPAFKPKAPRIAAPKRNPTQREA